MDGHTMNIFETLNKNFVRISDEYTQFATSKDKCRKCDIYNHYQQVGQAEGNALDPTFMIVGESMGQDEVIQNRPFIGKAGQRLREELRKYPAVFNKETTIITNVLGCRPLNNQFPSDHKIAEVCFDTWLRKEISILRPKIIIMLGNKALTYLHPKASRHLGVNHGKPKGITALRGNWEYLPKYHAWGFATYHPSYVIRSENDASKSMVAEEFEADIKKISDTWTLIYTSINEVEEVNTEID